LSATLVSSGGQGLRFRVPPSTILEDIETILWVAPTKVWGTGSNFIVCHPRHFFWKGSLLSGCHPRKVWCTGRLFNECLPRNI
jgi:hypothetical protein